MMPMTPIVSTATPDLPLWVEEIFALADGETGTVTPDGVTFEIDIAAIRLEPCLRPVRIVSIQIPNPSLGRTGLDRLSEIQAGSRYYGRPLETLIRPVGYDRDEDRYAYQEALWAGIAGYDRLGFHMTDGVSHETLERVSLAYLPDGLDLPLRDHHRELGRIVVGLDRSCRARRNAFCAAIATPTYASLMEMRAAGYAMKTDTVAGRAFFGLTARGFAAIMRPGETMIWAEPPERIVRDTDS